MTKKRHTNITKAQREARSKNAAKATEMREQARVARRAETAQALTKAGVPIYELSEARLMAARAELAERELAEHKGRFLDIEEARGDVIAAFSLVKTRLLGVPTLVGQRLPELAVQVVPIVDELIRDALSELSSRGIATSEDDDLVGR